MALDMTRELGHYQLTDFWGMAAAQRQAVLLWAVAEAHAWHYERNRAYRHTVSARGVGPAAEAADLPLLLRPTAQTFKSYIDLLGTPFPQDQPHGLVEWLADQLSVELPRERFARLRQRYGSLEALLRDIERLFADLGLEMSTSSGTSGRSSIVVRDQEGMDRTVESFYLAFQRQMGMQADHRVIFIMPRQTRIAMARMAHFSVKRVGLTDERVQFAIPFPAYPDHVRIRAGRTFRPGWQGTVERKLWHPAMNWINDRYVTIHAVRQAITWLRQAEAAGEKVLLFGGLVHLHAIARELGRQGQSLRLAPGSLLGTGGGLKELYPFAPPQIHHDLAQVFELADGSPIPIRDVYGMAEGNWAAMQCQHGNYHVPPWVYTVTLDQDGGFQEGPDTTGLLAFFDPFGGGKLFPAFFRTADRVRLIDPDGHGGCPCGETGAYFKRDSIQRVDLLDEAGCAAQV
jgi:hypothetical protein